MSAGEDINFSADHVPETSVVYFARSEKTNLIKIGFSYKLAQRMRSVGSEVRARMTVIHTVKGAFMEESYFHRRFGSVRDHGEWFREEGPLLSFLKKIGKDSKKLAAELAATRERALVLAQAKERERARRDKIPLTSPMLLGYARVSTAEQNLDMQLAMLEKEGVHPDYIFAEKLSAKNAKRPQFHLMMKMLEPGDTIVVYSMSRLARDVRKLHAISDEIFARGAKLRSLTEPHLDTSTAEGRLMFTMKGAIDQFERENTQRRTVHGLAERKRQGMYLGAPRVVTDKMAKEMKRLRKTMKVGAIAAKFGVKPSTVYAYTKG